MTEGPKNDGVGSTCIKIMGSKEWRMWLKRKRKSIVASISFEFRPQK